MTRSIGRCSLFFAFCLFPTDSRVLQTWLASHRKLSVPIPQASQHRHGSQTWFACTGMQLNATCMHMYSVCKPCVRMFVIVCGHVCMHACREALKAEAVARGQVEETKLRSIMNYLYNGTTSAGTPSLPASACIAHDANAVTLRIMQSVIECVFVKPALLSFVRDSFVQSWT